MDPQAAQTTVPGGSGAKKVLAYLLLVLVLIIIIGLGFLLLRGEPKEPGPKVVTGLERGSITIGSNSRFTDIFPNSSPDFKDVVFDNNIFDGLGRIVEGQVKPALATSWTNPDNITWVFKLRKGVKFHNGDPFTAADVKFSIDQALKNDWPNSFNLSTVKSVEVVDDFTVNIKTTSPDPVLLNRLVLAFIVSEKQFKEKEKSEEAVGTGPYKFVSLDKENAVLEANEGYYLGAPKVKRVIYKFYPAETTDKQLVEKVQKGEVDLVQIDVASAAQNIGSGLQLKSLTDPFITILWLDLDRDKTPFINKTPNPLKNKKVRQAIFKVMDISSVTKDADLSAVAASQLVNSSIFGYNPEIQRPLPNVEEAKKLMEEAGFANGFNLTIDIFQGREMEVDAVAKELKKININVKTNSVTLDNFVEKILIKRDTSAFIVDYAAETYDAGEIFTNVLHTPKGSFGSDNLSNYSNSEIDKLAEEIATTFDSKTRLGRLQSAMVKAMEELPLIPLYNKENFYIINNNFDWTPTAFGAIYPNEITGREIVTQ